MTPCCKLSMVGGDGTGIGIPTHTFMDIEPVWIPPGRILQAAVKWNAKERRVLFFEPGASDERFEECRAWVMEMISLAEGKCARRQQILQSWVTTGMPECVAMECIRCSSLPDCTERSSLETILQAVVSEASATSLLPVASAYLIDSKRQEIERGGRNDEFGFFYFIY
jgi:hypothetical protein